MEDMLVLDGLTKTYGDFYAAKEVTLKLKEGEFLTLLGPSGSGKTTTLKMVAGLEIPTDGRILIKGEDITYLPPDKRGLGMVFQNYALFPHMTIKENIMFPLKMKKKNLSKAEMENLAMEYLRLVQLEHVADRKPSQLSGGQQQRIALARALVYSPPIVLMDEPLGALDKKLRGDMQLEIKRIQKKLNITTIYVTHDQEEALTMSDRIAIMNKGEIAMMGTPDEIYERPNSVFVADFIGESNLIPVSCQNIKKEQMVLKLNTKKESVFSFKPLNQILPEFNENTRFVIRPEKMIVGTDLGAMRKVTGKIIDVIYLGESVKYIVSVDDEIQLKIKQQAMSGTKIFSEGDIVEIGWPDEAGQVLN